MKFFLRMINKSFTKQFRKRILIALTVMLSAAVSVAMLGVVYDVGDKLNDELSTYGSNITVRPQSSSVVTDLYSSGSSSTPSSSQTDPTSFINESDVSKIKTIFWAYNITNFAPQLNIHMSVTNEKTSQKASNVPIVGTWFNKTVKLSTGESTTAGVENMRSWWSVQGRWAKDDALEAMVGSKVAQSMGISVGNSITVRYGSDENNKITLKVVGIYSSDDDDDKAIYTSTEVVQTLSDLENKVDYVEVKALTTPENDLARKAAKNPNALSDEEWETWYCTAYPSSIAYQIEEALPGTTAKQVRQVAALEGSVLEKTQAVMIVMTALTLVAAAIAVANLMAAAIAERSSELALMKALGAKNAQVSRLILAETAVIAFIGAVIGSLLGVGLAQLVGEVVFGSSITMRPMVFVLVFVLLALTVFIASLSAIRSILKLHPAQVLHGR